MSTDTLTATETELKLTPPDPVAAIQAERAAGLVQPEAEHRHAARSSTGSEPAPARNLQVDPRTTPRRPVEQPPLTPAVAPEPRVAGARAGPGG